MHMDAGDVVMTLDRDNAPCAVHSLESLVTQGYFDDTICHRLAPDFVLQCGDPTATGRGGPGYRFADELTGQENYRYATVAMANAGPDTNGSQFFIVIASDAHLPPSYTVLGTVDANSMKVVDAIAAQGIDPNDPNASVQGGLPSEGGHIASMTVS
jgi:peptidyl-prolyl cis-trans isomerase B (cyclophilin B)